MQNLRALTDGDIVAYRSAAICEERWFLVFGPQGVTEVKGATVAKKLAKGQEIDEFYKYKPEEAPLGTVKRTLNKIKKLCGGTPEVYLSPGTQETFRAKIAVTAEYKGNRKDVRRPHYLPNCRKYLQNQWNAVVCDGIEADDMLGIEQYKDVYRNGKLCQPHEANTVIVSVDKDLRMIPGWHFDYVNDKTEWITEEGYLELKGTKLVGGGLKWFYAQLLIGDATDNIIGPKGIGNKTAYKLLGHVDDPRDMENIILNQYKKQFGDSARERMVENGRLLWILRHPAEAVDLWVPKYV